MDNEQNFSEYRYIKDYYKIGHTLGQGSFATVKKCKNKQTGKKCAVKVLYKKKLSDEDKINLQTEIEIMQQMDHPNIVRLVDVFQDEKFYCLVMELV